MVGSQDFSDFCIEPVEEKITTIPLHSWQTISLSDIWIPSHLLVSRNQTCNTKGTHGIYHTLQKKDIAKYSESFSVYIDTGVKNEQEDIFLSDSDEDIENFALTNSEKIKSLSNNLSLDSDDVAMHSSKSFNHGEKKYFENLNNNPLLRRNDDNMYSNSTSDVNNFYKYDEHKNVKMSSLEKNPETSHRNVGKDDNIFIQNIEKIDFSASHSSSASKGGLCVQFKDHKILQTLKRVNRDSDSLVSLNEILNDAPVVSLKDFVCDFVYKKKDSDNSSICDKQKLNSKKSRKDKKGKKQERCVPLQSLFEDNNATQEFNCNRYMNSIICERERYARIGDNPLCSKEEYPDLTPEEVDFIHSDNVIEAEHVKRQKCSKIDDNSLCSKENLDLTSEELTFIYSDNQVKEESSEYTPTFSFLHSDKATKNCPLVSNYETVNESITAENNTIVEKLPDVSSGKLIIENLPSDITKDDISSILCGYGEIKNFSMISSGKYLKVFVEIDLICDIDIDWVIECLNGSEPFGTSTGVLKCYQQTE